MKHVYMLFFKDKSIENGPSMIQGDQEAFGHPQRPFQGQPCVVQQVPELTSHPLNRPYDKKE